MSERGTLSSRSRARAHARGIYPAETVAITSFPWELFGNRWGKFPRTGQPAQPRFVVPTPPNALSPPPSLFLSRRPSAILVISPTTLHYEWNNSVFYPTPFVFYPRNFVTFANCTTVSRCMMYLLRSKIWKELEKR